MKRRTRIALGGALLLAAPVAGFQLVQAGWRRDTAALLRWLEEEGLGASPAALGLDGPVAEDADALARASRAVADLPSSAGQYLATPPAELSALFGPNPPSWALTYDPQSGEPGPPEGAAETIRWILARLDVIEATIDRLGERSEPKVDRAAPPPAAEPRAGRAPTTTPGEAGWGPIDGARDRRGRFPVDWSRGIRAELPHLFELKSLLGALQLRAGWRLREGDAAGAWLDVERMLALTARLDDPILIGRLVRASCLQLVATTIVDLVALGPLPAQAQRVRLDAALARSEELDGFQRALRGDLRALLRTFEVEGASLLEDDTTPRSLREVQLWLTLHRVEREWATVMARAVRAARQGSATERHDALLAWAADVKQSASPIVVLLATPCDRAFVREVDAVAASRLARVALRLGATDLPPLAPRLPVDPWSGAPLLYARDPDGTARVWSVGVNRTDEGGAVPTPGAGGTPSDVVIRLGLPPPPPGGG